MIVLRRRYLYWLIKAYIKKWGKSITLFFLIGILGGFFLFFLLKASSEFIISKINIQKNESIGIVGLYTTDTLPMDIHKEISLGLTSVSEGGKISPSLASSWSIKDNNKTYIFKLKKDLKFTDGTKLSSDFINYSFKDVKIEKPDKETIVFKLKDVYAPFLLTVSRPIFKKGLKGLGDYKVKKIKFNGNFVKSLTLVSVKNPSKQKNYHFYPNEESLKTAFLLGEITNAKKLSNTTFKNMSIKSSSGVKINRYTDYSEMTALFFNNQDKLLSDKKLRNSLVYALPDEFQYGERAFSPFPDFLWTHEDVLKRQDLEHAKNLYSDATSSSKSAEIKLTIKSTPKYKNVAVDVATSWKKIGIKSFIEVVETIPESFQIYLTDFNVPLDPDQYTLWHSDQKNNISNYKNLRIDKLLEDGRKTLDMNSRKKIYSDFQKYLMDDSPAAFLYFPYKYNLVRE